MEKSLKISFEQIFTDSNMSIEIFSQLGHGGDMSYFKDERRVCTRWRTYHVCYFLRSKGYPAAEWEMREFFKLYFGDCILTNKLFMLESCFLCLKLLSLFSKMIPKLNLISTESMCGCESLFPKENYGFLLKVCLKQFSVYHSDIGLRVILFKFVVLPVQLRT